MHTIGQQLHPGEHTILETPRLLKALLMICFLTLLAGDTAMAQTGALGLPVSVHVNGAFQSSASEFRAELPFSVYGEQGLLQTDHRTEGGGIIDVGGYVTVWRQLAVGATFTQLGSSDSATMTGSVPHPLIANQPRSVGPESLAFKHRERTTHIHIAWVFPIGSDERLDITVSGGPSFFSVTRGVLGDITITETGPPFSEVMVNVGTRENTSNAWGGHVGADVTYMVTSVFGLGGFFRFATGSVDIPIASDPVPVDVGGVQAGGGVRVRF